MPRLRLSYPGRLSHRLLFTSRSFLVGCLFLLAVATLPFQLCAQTTSTIEGYVTDHQGLAVAAVEVRLAGRALAFDHSTATDANGAYHIDAIPAGSYTLTVSHPGFATQVFRAL